MTTKEIVINTIQSLPDDSTWDSIQERINFMAGVRKGLREQDEGKGIPHDQVKKDFESSSFLIYSEDFSPLENYHAATYLSTSNFLYLKKTQQRPCDPCVI